MSCCSRVLFARRTRLAVDLAGSQGIARVAATAQADSAIQRNATSFATMRLAATADTATFITAAETVLEPDVWLSVVAPATPDATLADARVALAAMRLI